MRKHICYYMRENIMMLAAQSARATMLVIIRFTKANSHGKYVAEVTKPKVEAN